MELTCLAITADVVTIAAFALATFSVIAIFRSRAKITLAYWYDTEGHFDFQVTRAGQSPANNLMVDFVKRDTNGEARSGGDLVPPQIMVNEFRICGLEKPATEKCQLDRIHTFAFGIEGAHVVDFLVTWQSPILLWRRTYRLFRFNVDERAMHEYKGRQANKLFNKEL